MFYLLNTFYIGSSKRTTYIPCENPLEIYFEDRFVMVGGLVENVAIPFVGNVEVLNSEGIALRGMGGG